MDNFAFISLGSNMGDRESFLKKAIDSLGNNENIIIEKLSSIYETDPVGYTDQDCFLNMVVQIKTGLSPIELLRVCLNIEEEIGRVREIRWGPRVIDLDILLYNDENIEMESLQVPHPRLQERAFVIVPLLEINRSIKLPTTNAPLAEVLDEIPDKEGVRLWKQINGEDAYALFES